MRAPLLAALEVDLSDSATRSELIFRKQVVIAAAQSLGRPPLVMRAPTPIHQVSVPRRRRTDHQAYPLLLHYHRR